GAGGLQRDERERLAERTPPSGPGRGISDVDAGSGSTDAAHGSSAGRRRRDLPDLDDLRDQARRAVRRGREAPTRNRPPLPDHPPAPVDVAKALRRALGEKKGAQVARRLREAATAFEAERFADARRLLGAVVKDAPDVPDGHELLGLTHYRIGRWDDAIERLETFRVLAGTTEQHPVLSDCHRALGHWGDVEELWRELREVSPSAALVTEGRIVAAGARADRGDLAGGIRVLEQGWRPPKRPRPHHLRRAYAMADLYERAGRAPRARELFAWVVRHDPTLADVAARARALS
ncbi:MAG: tetratricopeptide repeat protein, partial [Acidimicrobiales bacterium]